MRGADGTQSFTIKAVTYEPIADSIFELPQAVKALLK
jgi:ABC-type cobalt transport system substrate-binding protein